MTPGMSNRVRRSLLLLAVTLSVLLGIGLWPAADPAFRIVDDADKLAQKQQHLRKPRSLEGARPNIVLILADDLGREELNKVPTPHLQKLGAEGVNFTDGYITSPICSPSRAALMTGRYQQRFGFEIITHERYPRNRLEWFFARMLASGHGWHALDELLVPPAEEILRQGIPPSELTIAELLKQRGYATGIFGKWHLGFNESSQPLSRGFDYQYGFLEAFSLYADPHDEQIVNARVDLFADKYHWWKGRHGNCAIQRNGQEVDEKVYLTESIASEAARWIGEHKGEPFFAYVPFSAPHAPLQAPRKYVERFSAEPDERKRVYYAMIAALDDAVGEILRALDDAGVRDNTLVMFTSDNGTAEYLGVGSGKPGKFTNFEGGVRVPMLLRYPAKVRGGQELSQPVSSLDLFMTAVAAAGAELPARTYDGVDLLPLIEANSAPERALFWRSAGHRAIRHGRFKLVSDQRTGSRALYDVVADPKEEHQVEDPATTEALEARLVEWERSLVQPSWPRVMDYHFVYDGKPYVFPL